MKNIHLNFFLFISVLFSSCKEYLEVKPDKKLVVPSTLQEAQSLMNHHLLNNGYPGATEVASGDMYLRSVDWLSASSELERHSYIWSPDVYNATPRNDWSLGYEKVYYANIVIDGIRSGKIDGESEVTKNDILGQALFFRSYSFFTLLQVFAPQWDGNNANRDLGIPLRLSPDFNIPSYRATVEEGYKQIIEDVLESAKLLPERSPVKTRPDRRAANALLSRIYLVKGDYENAVLHATRSLALGDELLNFNKLDFNASFPFVQFNTEVIWHSAMNALPIFTPPVFKVVPEIISSLDSNDLRKELYFMQNTDQTYSFKGSYCGSVVLFSGLAVNEVYLIKAEALARLGKSEAASETLNTLLSKRFKEGTYSKNVFQNQRELLTLILKERRKELVFRGLRWSDLRRLNKEPDFQTTLIREVDGDLYSLRPSDEAYVFKIPDEVIRLTGLQQN